MYLCYGVTISNPFREINKNTNFITKIYFNVRVLGVPFLFQEDPYS